MATWHHLNGQLFMPAKWLREMDVHPKEITIQDENTRLTRRGNRLTPEEALWVRKEDEAISAGITESIEREGIVNPVKVTGGRYPMIRNGFHRVASVDPLQMVPITYDEGAPEAQSERLPAHTAREGELHHPDSDEHWE
jgi:hypothetical protein